jgi:hypothetical protein
LKAGHIKYGVIVGNALNLRDVPFRKFSKDVLNEVKHGRHAVIVSDYGKPYGVFLPLPVEEE